MSSITKKEAMWGKAAFTIIGVLMIITPILHPEHPIIVKFVSLMGGVTFFAFSWIVDMEFRLCKLEKINSKNKV